MKNNKKFYTEVCELGLVCTSIDIIFTKSKVNSTGYTKKIMYNKPVNGKYIQVVDDEGNLVKNKSMYDKNKNFIYCWMGNFYGGYITIDIDIKDNNTKPIDIYKNKVGDIKTLTGTTPCGGIHFIYKLTKKQREIIGETTFNAKLNLFNQTIDILYNRMRVIMCGSDNNYTYEITNLCQPAKLPDIVFNDIISRINGKLYSNDKEKTHKKHKSKKRQKDLTENDLTENNVLKTEYTEHDNKIQRRLNILDIEKSTSYCRWFSICQAIKNEGGSLRLFVEFSKKMEYYDFNECVFKWNENNPEYIGKATIGTINYYAKSDSPNKYDNLINNERELMFKDKILLKYLNSLYDHYGDKSFADIIYHLYPDEYIYDDQFTADGAKIKGTWFRYNNYGIYEECNTMIHANKLISTEIHDLIETHSKWYYYKTEKNLKSEKVSKRNRTPILKSIKRTSKQILSSLLKTATHKAIIPQMRIMYECTDINFKFDKQSHLVGFKNGVYDLKNRCFRKALPEEYIYSTTKYCYEKADKKYLYELNELIERIFPDENERTYVMTTVSFGISGENYFQEFYMWLGYGGNGKSLLTLLTTLTLGPIYAKSWKPDALKEKGTMNSNEKSQVYAGAANARIVFVTECNFNNANELDYHNLKAITGGEEVSCKFLYCRQTEYRPNYHINFVTNAKIPMNMPDNSMIRRARNCPFRVTFVKKEDYDKNNKYLSIGESGLEKKIKSDEKYKYAFFEILCNYFFAFVDNDYKLEIPESIKRDNDGFNDKNNIVKSFFDKCITMTNDNKDRIMITTLVKVLKGFDDTFRTTIAKLSESITAFSYGKLTVVQLNGYPTCKCIKFKSAKEMKHYIQKDILDQLIDDGIVK
jgi:phage/plasmid-associated DNA primase